MFCSETITVKAARKAHRCTWCGERIEIGATYKTWRSIDDGVYVNKMHPECCAALDAEMKQARGYVEYYEFENDRPRVKLFMDDIPGHVLASSGF